MQLGLGRDWEWGKGVGGILGRRVDDECMYRNITENHINLYN
jgi:hypothetical protein